MLARVMLSNKIVNIPLIAIRRVTPEEDYPNTRDNYIGLGVVGYHLVKLRMNHPGLNDIIEQELTDRNNDLIFDIVQKFGFTNIDFDKLKRIKDIMNDAYFNSQKEKWFI